MVNFDDSIVKLAPLIAWEMSELHLTAHINSNRNVKQVEGKLFEVFVVNCFFTDFVKSKQIVLSFFLVMKPHEILTNLFHSVFSILNWLNLHNCFLFGCHHCLLLLLFVLLLILLLLFILLDFLLLLFTFLILFLIGLLSFGSLQPVFSTNHRIRWGKKSLIVFLIVTAIFIVVLFWLFLTLLTLLLSFGKIGLNSSFEIRVNFLELLLHGVKGSSRMLFHLLFSLSIAIHLCDFVFHFL